MTNKGKNHADKTFCQQALEDGGGIACNLRRHVAAALGGDDLGVK